MNLNQNFPNPFNLSTTICYSVAEAQRIELIIFDMLGNKIRTLFDGVASGGMNQITWNGKNNQDQVVNSGIYFYRIVSKEATLNGKMILNK